MARFQMIDSNSPNTIAVVTADGDIEAFRNDPGWYELEEEEQKEPPKRVKKQKE